MSLDLSKFSLGYEIDPVVAENLTATLIEHFKQCCEDIGIEPRDILIEILKQSSQGRTVQLSGIRNELRHARITVEEARAICMSLRQNPICQHLDLSYNNLTDEAGFALAKLLSNNKFLTSINFAFNEITSSAKSIIGVLEDNSSLTKLNLHGNRFGHEAGTELASVLNLNSTLEEIDIGDTDQNTDSILALMLAVTYSDSVVSLNLENPRLIQHQEETTMHICKMVKSNNKIKNLNLNKFGMTDQGSFICKGWGILNILDSISNKIAFDGGVAIGKFLARPECKIEYLDLRGNRIGDPGAKEIATALTTNKSLRYLNLCANSVEEEGLVALADAIRRYETSLEHIHLWGNNFSSEAAMAWSLVPPSLVLDVKVYQVDNESKVART